VSSQHTTPSDDNAPGFRAIRFNMDWITRPLFGIVLGIIALGVVSSGPKVVAIFVAVGFTLAALEWHRCVGGGTVDRAETALTALSIMLAEAVFLYTGLFWAGLLVVALAAIASFGLALTQGEKHPFWQAVGVPYLTIPALCLLALCSAHNGALIVSGMLIIVWFTDTGALIFGNLIGGKRLAPKLSPAKTWAGTIGGSLLGALVFTFYARVFPGAPALTALAFGFIFSFVAHAGDLFESFVKRRFGVKNSGAVIPGHGGVLDRIDSTLAAAPVMALLVLVLHFNPVFWVHA
jgi:phosphatidate cytidylyltransferase